MSLFAYIVLANMSMLWTLFISSQTQCYLAGMDLLPLCPSQLLNTRCTCTGTGGQRTLVDSSLMGTSGLMLSTIASLIYSQKWPVPIYMHVSGMVLDPHSSWSLTFCWAMGYLLVAWWISILCTWLAPHMIGPWNREGSTPPKGGGSFPNGCQFHISRLWMALFSQ